MENEKDNFWLYIAGVIILAVGLVFMLKSREMESVPYNAYQETNSQVEKQMKNAK